jgi:hypothetical protein
MSVPYHNPISSIQVSTPQSVPRTSVFGTNFSILNVGGYMEVYNLSDLTLTLTSSTYPSLIQLSANTIPIRYTKGLGTFLSPDYLTLNSDNISSGRRRLGMMAYVHETDKVYQYVIPNYDTLWNNLSGLTGFSSVTYSDYTTVINNRSSAGQSFIQSWTASTIEGVNGYTSSNANWRIFQTGSSGGTSGIDVFVTGGTYNGGQLLFTNNTGGTFTVTGVTSSGLSSNYYASFSNTTNIIVSGANISTVWTYNTTEISNGIIVENNSRIKVLNDGIYEIGYSGQIEKTQGGSATDVTIWALINGLPVDRSSSTVTLVSNSSYQLPFVSYIFNLNANDYVEFYFSAPSDHIQLTTLSGLTSPTRPISPSVIIVAKAVGNAVLSNSGDTYVTGLTLSNDTLSLTQNRLGTYSGFSVNLPYLNTSGGTISGNLNVTGSISATTYYGDGSNLSGVSRGGGGGAGGQLYYFNISSAQTPYYEFSTTATTSPEQSITVSTGSTQTAYIGGFLTPSGVPNKTDFPAGILSFYLHCYTNNSNTTFSLYSQLFKRSTGNTETLLFTSDITSVVGTSTLMYITDGYFSGATLNTSDRLLVKLYATNTSNNTRSITFLSEGSQHYSFALTTIPTFTDTYVTGFTLSNNTLSLTQNTTGAYSGFSVNLPYLNTSGGTVTGATNFTGGVTANTISATTISLPFTSGSTLFAGTSGQISQNNSQFFWDNVNNRFGVGTNTPAFPLQVGVTNVGSGSDFTVQTSSSAAKMVITSQSSSATIGANPQPSTTNGVPPGASFGSTTNGARITLGYLGASAGGGTYLNFSTNGAQSGLHVTHNFGSDLLTVYNNGNTGIGTSTDGGFKLDVSGTTRISGNLSLTTGSILNLNSGLSNNGLVSAGSSFLQFYNRGQVNMTLFNGGSEAQQGVQIGYNLSYALTPPDLVSSLLNLVSTTKGFLSPRMTTVQKNAITTPSTGLTVYDTTTLTPSFYNGTNWQNVLIPNSLGNVLVGTTTDAGYKLDVSGTTRLSALTQNILTVIGSGNSTTSPIFSVQGSQGELFSITDSLTGSLFSVNDISGLPILEVFSDNTILMGNYLAPSLNTTARITLTAGTNTIYSIPVSAYTGAFFDYTLISTGTTGARAGTIMSIWSGTTAQFTETSTNDIGTTTGVTFSVTSNGTLAQLSSSATTTGWIVETIIRSV